MKRAIKIAVLLLASGMGPATSYAQNPREVFSVYFHKDSFKELELVPNVVSTYFKKYELAESEENAIRRAAGEFLVADETGVYLEKNKLLFITREQIREESKYQVRNGYIFGVMENDSLPTALDGENYYFLIPSKTYLVPANDISTKIYKGLNNGEYLVVTAEPNGYFSCIYFRFKAGALDVMELPLDTDQCSVKLVKEQKVIKGDYDTFILTATVKEWQTLFGCFSVYDNYRVAG
jgi:hypothetical protein